MIDVKLRYKFVLTILVFFTGNVYAAKIYKWVDQQGNVHFSSNAQFAKPRGKIENIKIGAVKKSKNDIFNDFDGRWYSEYKNRKFEFKFSKETVTYYEARKDGQRATLFVGRFKREAANLNILYRYAPNDFVEIGEIESYKIISKSSNKLMLLFPDNTVLEFYRFDRAEGYSDSRGNLLNGSWKKEKSNIIIEFVGNRFYLKKVDDKQNYSETQYYTFSQGQWYKKDKTLLFTYFGHKNFVNKVGSKKSYKIMYLGDRKIILENIKTKEIIKYDKIILD